MPEPSSSSHVLTLIAGGTTLLTAEHVYSVASHFASTGALTWLHAGRSVAAPVRLRPQIDAATTRAAIAHSGLETLGIDCCILPADHRRKKLLIADMESTIIQQEMLDELAGEIGLREKVADITERAMRGELDFEAALNERVGLLAGLDASILERMAATRITLMPGAGELVATMKAHGAYCALVSGGFTCFTGPVAARLGFDEHQANTLEVAEGKLTGRVIPPILGREAKLAALQRLCSKLGIDLADTVAVGDGANDLSMLGAAGLGVAFRAKPAVREAAAAMPNGAVITHADLTALLSLQGCSQTEIVAGPKAMS